MYGNLILYQKQYRLRFFLFNTMYSFFFGEVVKAHVGKITIMEFPNALLRPDPAHFDYSEFAENNHNREGRVEFKPAFGKVRAVRAFVVVILE